MHSLIGLLGVACRYMNFFGVPCHMTCANHTPNNIATQDVVLFI